MSKVVDTHVVEMKFDNRQFESGVSESLNTLEKLKKGLDFTNSAKGFEEVGKAANNMGLDGVGNAVENISNKFSALGVIGFTVLQNLTNSAVNFVKNGINKITSPIINGGISRATNIEKAKFQLSGLHVAWEQIKDDIDWGVKGTAYGLDSAARAASQLVAANVKFGEGTEDMKQALRGISGVAAMTSSTYDEIADIFLSVAGAGKVTGDTLQRLSARGLNAAATLGKALGKSEADIRKMVTKGQIDFNTFSKAMDDAFGLHAKAANDTFDGVLANIRSAWSRIGADFVTPIIENKGPVVQFLGKIRDLVDEIHDGTKPIAASFGNIVKNMANKGSEILDAIDRTKIATMLDSVYKSLINILNAIATFVRPIREAFKTAFPKSTVDNITTFANALITLTDKLKLSGVEIRALGETFRGFFDVLALIKDGFITVVHALFPFLSGVTSIREMILVVTALIGRFLTYLTQMIRKSIDVSKIANTITNAFKMVAMAILTAISAIVKFVKQIKELFTAEKTVEKTVKSVENFGEKTEKVTTKILKDTRDMNSGFEETESKTEKLRNSFTNLGTAAASIFSDIKSKISSVIDIFKSSASPLEAFKTILSRVGEKFKTIGDYLRNFEGLAGSGPFELLRAVLVSLKDVLVLVINTIEQFFNEINLGYIIVMAFASGVAMLIWNLSGAIRSVKGVADGATDVMKALKNTIKGIGKKSEPNTIRDLSIALIALAGSLKLISTIDAGQLANVRNSLLMLMGAFTVMYAIVKIIDKFTSLTKKGELITGVSGTASNLLALSGSILILVTALKLMEGLKLENIGKKVLAIGGIALGLAVAAGILHKITPGAAKGAFTVLALALGIKMIVKALADLGSFPLDQMNDSIVKFMGVMTGLAILAAGVGRIGFGGAMGILAFILIWKKFKNELLEIFDTLTWDQVKTGIKAADLALASLGAILLGLDIIAKKLGGGIKNLGIGLTGIAAAFAILAGVCYLMRNLKVEDFNTGLHVLGILSIMIGALMMVSEKTKDSRFIQFSVGMLILTGAFGALGLLARALGGFQNQAALWIGIGILTVLTVLIAILMDASGMTANAKIGPLLVVVAGLVALMTELAVLASLINTIGWQSVLAAAGSMGVVLLALGGMAALMSLATKKADQNTFKIIAAMVASIVAVAASIAALAYIPHQKLGKAILALSVMELVIIGCMALIRKIDGRTFADSKLNAIKTGVVMLVGVAGSLVLLSQFGKFGNGVMLGAVTSLGLILGELAFIIIKMGQTGMSFNKGQWQTLLSASVMMIAIAASLSALTSEGVQGGGKLTGAVAAMVITIGAFAGSLVLLNKYASKVTTSKNTWTVLAAGAIEMVAIGLTLSLMATQDWGSLLVAALAAGGTMIALAFAMSIMSGLGKNNGNLKEASVAILLASAALLIAAGAFRVMENIKWSTVIEGCVGIGVLAIALGLLSKCDATGLIAAAISMDIMALSIIEFAAAMKIMEGINWQTIALGIGAIVVMAGALGILGTLVVGSGGTLAVGMIAVALAMDLFAASIVIFAAGVEILNIALNGLQGVDIATIAEGLKALASSGWDMGNAAIAIGIASVAVGLLSLAVAGLGLSLSYAAPLIYAAVATICAAIELLSNTLLGLASKWEQAGKDGLNGLVKGLSNSSLLSKIFKKGSDAGGKALEGLSDKTGWHSPWEKMIQAGKDALKGLAEGLSNSGLLSSVFSGGSEAGQKALDGLDDALNGGGLDSILSLFGDNLGGGLEDVINNVLSEFHMDGLLGEDGPLSFLKDVLGDNEEGFDGASSSADEYASSLDGVGKSAKETKTPLEELTDTISNQMDIFSEFSMKEEISGQKMLENMRSQIAGVNKWATNLQILAARGIDQGLLQKLAELGPSGYEKVAAFTQMTQEQLLEANTLFAQSLTLPQAAASLITQSYSIGGDITKGLTNTMDATAAHDKGYEVGEKAVEGVAEGAQTHSPSKATEETGKNIDLGMKNGILNYKAWAVNAGKTMASELILRIKQTASYNNAYSIGLNIVKGIRDGIAKNQISAITAVSNMASSVINAAYKKFVIKSPSHVFADMGRYIDLGLARGINDYTNKAVTATEQLSEKTIQGFQEATDGISKVMDWDMDLSPVITPQLDLEGIRNDAGLISGIFGEQSMAINGQLEEQRMMVDQLSNKLGTVLGDVFMNQQGTPVEVNVSLTGDAGDIFRVVRTENRRYTNQTGRSAFM